MTMKKYAQRWVALCMLPLSVGSAQALDLLGTYERALQHDPAHRAANAAVIAGREKIVQGNALLHPRVGLQAGLGHLDNHMPGGVPSALSSVLPAQSNGTLRSVSVQLTHPLYDAAARTDRAQLHLQAAMAETQHDQARQLLALQVSEAYFGVLLAQEAMRVTHAEKTAIGKQRDRAQARFDIGRGKVTDLQEARARYDQILSKEISVASVLTMRRAQLAEIVGVSATDLSDIVAGHLPEQPVPDDLSAWQAMGETHNPLVRTKRSQLEAARAEIDRHRQTNRPTLHLLASYTARGQNGSLSPLVAARSDRTSFVGLQFNMPLYAGGALDSREREALARLDEAEQQLAAAQRDVRLQVQDRYLAVKTSISRIGAFEQSLVSARTALEATTLGRDVGTRTELDVLDAQQRFFAAEFDLAQARLDYLLGRIRLAAAAGDLNEDHLRAANLWLAVY